MACKFLILLDHYLSLPAGQTENRDGSGAENSEIGMFQQLGTRSTSVHVPWETPKKKGPEIFRALVYGGGWLTMCRLASRAYEHLCGLLRACGCFPITQHALLP